MSMKLASVLVRTLIGIAAFLAVVFVAGVAVGYLSAHGTVDEDQALFWIVVAVAVAAMCGSMAISVAWMRSIDEAAREAHKAAWFWGGCSGMALGGVVLIMSSIPQAADWTVPTLDGRTDPAAYAATGAFAMMLLMTAGYAVVWAWWWITRMRD